MIPWLTICNFQNRCLQRRLCYYAQREELFGEINWLLQTTLFPVCFLCNPKRRWRMTILTFVRTFGSLSGLFLRFVVTIPIHKVELIAP